MNKKTSLISAFLILGIAFIGAVLAFKLRPVAEKTQPVIPTPVLEVLTVRSEAVSVVLYTQGTLRAREESILSAEVSGRILEVSPHFETGGTFHKGDLLLRIDDADYRAALAQAKAQVAQAELAYAQELAAADQALRDWEKLGRGEASPLTLRKPQLERAKAQRDSAHAAVDKAQRDIERTRLYAPYMGRILEKWVSLNDLIATPATRLAHIYATDTFEIDLNLSASDYAQLMTSLGNLTAAELSKVEVKLTARWGTHLHTWDATLDRFGASIDPRNRLYTVTARIESARDDQPSEPRLQPGLFLEAEIHTPARMGIVEIPRAALLDNETVLIVDTENKLHRRTVEVIHANPKTALIEEGLQTGERVVLTAMEFIVEGMQVEPLETTANSSDASSVRPASIRAGEQQFGQPHTLDSTL